MRIRVLVAFLLSALLVEPASAQVLPVPPGWQMERAILLARHSVRLPLNHTGELDQHVASPWPTWPVPPGDLTPRGADLGRQMGRYYRVLYGGARPRSGRHLSAARHRRGLDRYRPAYA